MINFENPNNFYYHVDQINSRVTFMERFLKYTALCTTILENLFGLVAFSDSTNFENNMLTIVFFILSTGIAYIRYSIIFPEEKNSNLTYKRLLKLVISYNVIAIFISCIIIRHFFRKNKF